jgi:putative nucleotidyltransferase with HDIG domain
MIDPEALQRFRAEVVARRNLPTIPPILARILSIVGSDTAGTRQLVELIEKDQTLTAKLLRLANGAFFGQSRRVSTVPRAILLLGFSTVRNLALGVKVWDAVGSGVSPKRLEALWDHSVAVATCARVVGARMRACDPDEAFTAGLLHDIGRLVIATRFRSLYWQAAEQEGGDPSTAAEESTFGVGHAEVGAWLLEAWRLPPTIVESVRLHHEENPRGELPSVLALTNRLVRATDIASGTVKPEIEALVNGLAAQGLTPSIWLDLVVDLRDSGAFEGFGKAQP